MELELNTTHLNCYDTVLNTTVFQEETLESIVPDACPDILRIVDAETQICLKAKEAQEGRAEVSGSLRAAILYLPDGAEGLRRMTVTIPFSCTVENPGLTSRCLLVAIPRVQSCDARSLNPRKVLTRVSIAVELQAFAPQTAAICDSVRGGEEYGIQQYSETQNAYLVTAVEEKPFTFSDDISLSGTKPRAEELLKTRVDLVCNESKIIGNKLIFKGEADLQLLYRDPEGNLCTAGFELPFSQIMEVTGVLEDADCSLKVLLTGCDCMLGGDDDDHRISVNLSMLAQAVVREERQVVLLSDIYSTLFSLTTDRKPFTFFHLMEQGTRRMAVREIIETPTAIKAVCDVYVTMGSMAQTREGPRLNIAAETAVTVVYVGEDDNISTITRTMPAACPLDLPEGCVTHCRCSCDGERFATPAGGGVEVRYPVDFHYMAMTSRNTVGVERVHLDESTPRNTAGKPSIVLRMVGERERLWDIAKAYGTTTDEIVRANALEEETPPMGQLLLIPKKR